MFIARDKVRSLIWHALAWQPKLDQNYGVRYSMIPQSQNIFLLIKDQENNNIVQNFELCETLLSEHWPVWLPISENKILYTWLFIKDFSKSMQPTPSLGSVDHRLRDGLSSTKLSKNQITGIICWDQSCRPIKINIIINLGTGKNNNSKMFHKPQNLNAKWFSTFCV